MKEYLIKTKSVLDGTQDIYRFDNDYGASVIRHRYSYGGNRGLYELAVIYFDGDDWSIAYNTPITDDVLGCLRESDVTNTLLEIKKL